MRARVVLVADISLDDVDPFGFEGGTEDGRVFAVAVADQVACREADLLCAGSRRARL